MKGLKNIVELLGAIPVPGCIKATKNFKDTIKNNILNSKKINNDFNWNNLTTATINGKKEYVYPAEYFRKLLIERYKNN